MTVPLDVVRLRAIDRTLRSSSTPIESSCVGEVVRCAREFLGGSRKGRNAGSMTDDEIRARCVRVVHTLIRTDMKVETPRTAAAIVDVLLLEFARAGIWLKELEPSSQYELTLRNQGDDGARVLSFTTDRRGAIQTTDLRALFL